MLRTGRPKTELILSEEEREQLLRWSRRAKSSQALALRSRIILGCGEGLDSKSVAEQVACSANTVSKWRARFVAVRLDGLVDEPRPGRPPTITSEQVEEVVVTTLEATGEERDALVPREDGRAQWTVEVDDRTDLEGVRVETASGGWVQTLQ